MLQKVGDHVTKALLEETCSEDKHMKYVLKWFNKAYNSIAKKIRGKAVE